MKPHPREEIRTRGFAAVRQPTLTVPAVLAAVLVFVLAGALALAGFAAPARAQEDGMPGAIEVGDGGASINGGGVYAGNGCAKAGPVTAGECEKDGKSGAEDKGGGGGSSGSQDAGPSDAQYGDEAADDAGSESSETTQLVTEMEGTKLTEGTTLIEGTTLADAAETPPEPAASQAGGDWLCAAEGPMGETIPATVEAVVDGDTLETSEGTVRLIGVDTPETVDPDQPPEPGGEEASDFTTDALESEEVELELGEETKDDYGRTLAYAWTDEGMFNEVLLREGYGELLIIEPNDAYEECLAAAEAAAREEGLGIWGEEAEGPILGMGTTVIADPSSETPAPPSDSAAKEGDGREGFLQTLFGGGEEDASKPAGGLTTFDATTFGPSASETTGLEPSATGGQYEEPERRQPEAQEEEIQEKEVQDPEVQEPEVQNPEIQEEELQEPEVQQGILPDSSAGAEDLEVAAPTPATATPAAAGVAAAAQITTLPETSGVSLARLALLLPGLLLGSGPLAWLVLKRPGVSAEGPADEGQTDEARG
jgi:micrococcal nuclease